MIQNCFTIFDCHHCSINLVVELHGPRSKFVGAERIVIYNTRFSLSNILNRSTRIRHTELFSSWKPLIFSAGPCFHLRSESTVLGRKLKGVQKTQTLELRPKNSDLLRKLRPPRPPPPPPTKIQETQISPKNLTIKLIHPLPPPPPSPKNEFFFLFLDLDMFLTSSPTPI